MCQKLTRGSRKHCFFFIFVLWHCFNDWWMSSGWVGEKSYLGPTEIASFSSWDFSWIISMTHSDMLYQLDIFKYFLWTIAVSDFRPLFLLSLLHFYTVFIIQIRFKCETVLLFFLIRNIVYRKKLFIEKNPNFSVVDYVKIIELHIVHKWLHV